eukprot:3874964-Amphidinium_carterae.2
MGDLVSRCTCHDSAPGAAMSGNRAACANDYGMGLLRHLGRAAAHVTPDTRLCSSSVLEAYGDRSRASVWQCGSCSSW